MEDSKIEWTDHTFNAWLGCTKISEACRLCYAEMLADHRFGWARWGAGRPRVRTSAEYWKQPLRWDRRAAAEGRRARVFCASLADVFDAEVPKEWRDDLWELIRRTTNLDWLLLTKRPENIAAMLPPDWGDGWANVWLGVTAENQRRADERLPVLLAIPAVVHFASCEPLLEPAFQRSCSQRGDFSVVNDRGAHDGADAHASRVARATGEHRRVRGAGAGGSRVPAPGCRRADSPETHLR